jgi:DNA-binding transcriptional regulator YdaS (Cro superfamily)
MLTRAKRSRKRAANSSSSSLRQAVKQAGGLRAVARKLNVRHQAVMYWLQKQVPAERVLAVEALTGIPRSVLRPDIYPPDREQA